MLVLLVALFTYSAHLCLIKSIFLRKPSKVAIYKYIGIIESILLDFFMYHT